MAKRFLIPAIAGIASVLPFVVLEAVNRRRFDEPFPWPLFGFMWVLAAAFILVLAPLVRRGPAGTKLPAAALVVRLMALLVIAMLWGRIVVDQMPCFLGVPNCD